MLPGLVVTGLEIWGDAGDPGWWQVQRVGALTRRAGGWAQHGDSVSRAFLWASSAGAGAGGAAGVPRGAAGLCEGWTCPAGQTPGRRRAAPRASACRAGGDTAHCWARPAWSAGLRPLGGPAEGAKLLCGPRVLETRPSSRNRRRRGAARGAGRRSVCPPPSSPTCRRRREPAGSGQARRAAGVSVGTPARRHSCIRTPARGQRWLPGGKRTFISGGCTEEIGGCQATRPLSVCTFGGHRRRGFTVSGEEAEGVRRPGAASAGDAGAPEP